MSDEQLSQKASPEEMMSDEQRAAAAQESAEFELTPEIEAIVMDKVQDINADGVAYSAVTSFFRQYGDREEYGNFQIIKNILSEGLLGSNLKHHFKNNFLRRWQWARTAKNREPEKNLVWFSINGRIGDRGYENKIENGARMMTHGVAIIFDTSEFKELPPGALNQWEEYTDNRRKIYGNESNIRPETRTFSAGRDEHTLSDVENFYKQQSDPTNPHGFVTPFRVSPGLFSGLVIG